MRIIKLNSDIANNVLNFFSELKRQDKHPCSFWGYSHETLSEALVSHDQLSLVGFDIASSNIVGFGVLKKGGPFQNHWAEISLAIHPNFRGNGYAQKMVIEIEKFKAEMDIEFIKALILENNIPSRRLFEKLGYVHQATLFHDFKLDGMGKVSDCVYYKI